jgi:hypothetical protein
MPCLLQFIYCSIVFKRRRIHFAVACCGPSGQRSSAGRRVPTWVSNDERVWCVRTAAGGGNSLSLTSCARLAWFCAPLVPPSFPSTLTPALTTWTVSVSPISTSLLLHTACLLLQRECGLNIEYSTATHPKRNLQIHPSEWSTPVIVSSHTHREAAL